MQCYRPTCEKLFIFRTQKADATFSSRLTIIFIYETEVALIGIVLIKVEVMVITTQNAGNCSRTDPKIEYFCLHTPTNR